jgi:hypothetical protein
MSKVDGIPCAIVSEFVLDRYPYVDLMFLVVERRCWLCATTTALLRPIARPTAFPSLQFAKTTEPTLPHCVWATRWRCTSVVSSMATNELIIVALLVCRRRRGLLEVATSR